MILYYILDDQHNPVEADLYWYAAFMQDPKNRVVQQDRIGEVKISTVFLGLDHRSSFDTESLPILFETMVFGGPNDGHQERYCTWNDAYAGHLKTVDFVKHEQLF
jgi:hypothetical protein